MDESKKLCSDMGISMERRIRKKKRMDGGGLTEIQRWDLILS